MAEIFRVSNNVLMNVEIFNVGKKIKFQWAVLSLVPRQGIDFRYLDTCSSQGLPSSKRRESSAILSIYIRYRVTLKKKKICRTVYTCRCIK